MSVMFVDFDIYRSYFGEGSRLCTLDDFECLELPDNWFYRLNHDGTGKKLKFPVKLAPRLHVRKLFVKENEKLATKTIPVERCNMFSCIEACYLDTL